MTAIINKLNFIKIRADVHERNHQKNEKPELEKMLTKDKSDYCPKFNQELLQLKVKNPI